MKNILLLFIALFALAVGTQAQNIDKKGLGIFLNDVNNVKGTLHKDAFCKDTTVIDILYAVDKDCYDSLSAVLEKYDVFFAEELFGLSLFMCVREAGDQKLVFCGNNFALVIVDNHYMNHLYIFIGQGIGYMHEAMDYVQMRQNGSGTQNVVGDEDVVVLSGGGFLMPVDIVTALSNHYTPEFRRLDRELVSAKGDQDRIAEIRKEYDAIRKQHDDEWKMLRETIEKLTAPAFVMVPCNGECYLVVPQLSEEEYDMAEPHARNGIYNWINSTGFCKGYDCDNRFAGKNGQRSGIVYPIDAAMAYAKKHRIDDSVVTKEPSSIVDAIFKKEIQGGVPVYLYRVSETEEGYNCMINDLGALFGLEEGGIYEEMEVVYRIEKKGKRLLQLYSRAGTVLLYDSPADRLCRMDVVIGGIGAFKTTVDDFVIDGVKGVTGNCNIVVNLGKIEIIEGPHKKNGVLFESGVHFETGYWEEVKTER